MAKFFIFPYSKRTPGLSAVNDVINELHVIQRVLDLSESEFIGHELEKTIIGYDFKAECLAITTDDKEGERLLEKLIKVQDYKPVVVDTLEQAHEWANLPGPSH